MAKRDPAFVASLERRLMQFVKDQGRRLSLPPMSRAQRAVAHELAEHFGLVTCSYGEGSRRHVDVFSVARASRPAILLSHAAAMPADAIAPRASDQSQFQIRIYEIGDSVSIERVLRPFDDRCQIEAVETAGGGSERILRFESRAQYMEARNHLGGGLRGMFKTDYITNALSSGMGSAPDPTPCSEDADAFAGIPVPGWSSSSANADDAWDDG